jgi:hypothetical protein
MKIETKPVSRRSSANCRPRLGRFPGRDTSQINPDPRMECVSPAHLLLKSKVTLYDEAAYPYHNHRFVLP